MAIDKGDAVFLQYTGGTTGISKGAALTHRNLIANLLQFSAALGPMVDKGKEIVITALPLTVNCLAFSYLGGHNVLIADTAYPNRAWARSCAGNYVNHGDPAHLPMV